MIGLPACDNGSGLEKRLCGAQPRSLVVLVEAVEAGVEEGVTTQPPDPGQVCCWNCT